MFNWGGWGTPEIDALIDAAGAELDRDVRLSLQAQALTAVKDDYMFLPLHPAADGLGDGGLPWPVSCN